MKRYLKIPVRGKYRITEGWRYSKHESGIHGTLIHGAVDFSQKRGSPVYAAAAGWAISSYHGDYAVDEKDRIKKYKGKPVGFSLGYFVQIYHPSVKRFTQYGHLGSIAEKIPFAKPRKLKGWLCPVGHKIPGPKLSKYKKAVWVKQGEHIGNIGDSGLTWGYTDYPKRPDPKKFPSWDETHTHFTEFVRLANGTKKARDPFDLYENYTHYPDSYRKKPKGKNHLWLS